MSVSLIEARAWIQTCGKFAPSRFASSEDALDFIYKLYRCGAVVVAVHDSQTLMVHLPDEDDFRYRLISLCNGELAREGHEILSDTGQPTIDICFASAHV